MAVVAKMGEIISNELIFFFALILSPVTAAILMNSMYRPCNYLYEAILKSQI